ncbi:MAG: DUF4476 domain-containing protein [Microscillaceae bacterium]|jgi:hypothetical protein|nr:DUF4476 domain-containing protein [Microscillaceae bacterium]
MKRSFFLIFGLLMAWDILAQNSPVLVNCSQPVVNFTFQQRKREIQTQMSDTQRSSVARQFVEGNCLSSVQVKEIADLFQDDYARLEFAKIAYLRTSDRHNFYEVYNAFQYFSTVFILHDYIWEIKMRNGLGNNNPNNNSNTTLNFPNLIYPNHLDYTGARRCENPLNDNDFYRAAWEISNLNTENNKIDRMGNLANNNCLTTAQLMRLATLLGNENNRLEFLKRVYNRVYDVGNYAQAVQVFSNQSNQQNLLAVLGNNPNNNNTWTPCALTAQEFADVRQRVSKEPFNNSKLSLAKSLIRIKKCFASQQIKELVKLFTFGKDQMDLAKFAYEFTTDQQNYYIISDVFTFASDREEFMKFVESKR